VGGGAGKKIFQKQQRGSQETPKTKNEKTDNTHAKKEKNPKSNQNHNKQIIKAQYKKK